MEDSRQKAEASREQEVRDLLGPLSLVVPNPFSRFALIAGGTPAVPANRLNDTAFRVSGAGNFPGVSSCTKDL